VLPVANIRTGTPDYFRTLGISLLAGRVFAGTDTETALPVAVISRSLARHYWRMEDPVGRRIKFDDASNWITIVGVVGDVRDFGLAEEPKDQIYVPDAQNPSPGSLLLRTAGDPMSLARQMRQAILDVDPQTAITRVETLEQARSDSISAPRVAASLFGLFAILAMVIAVTGIGCALALSVRQRTREIGIRASLGAESWGLVRMVVRQGMWLVLMGLALGLPCAFLLTGGLRTLLFQVAPTDAMTFGVVLVLLAIAALIACYVPARRAARIDPMVALRCD
jgi:putative ABC transport system permease protein